MLHYGIADHTLDNGLRVVVNPDHSVPAVAVNLWVGVGSADEPTGRTGFAHLFEHLMFQGSRHVASGEHMAALIAHGGQVNATTWFDRTNYFDTVPTGAFELALWLEADRHGHLLDAVTQDNLDNQRDVVKEEKRQRYDNVPYGTAINDLTALVFPPEHPYHHPTIGSMADLDAATLDDVHAFFRTWYVPGNTVLALSGDVTVPAAMAAAQRYFGALPPGEVPARTDSAPLAPLAAPVRLRRTEVVSADRLYIGFRLPPDNTADYLSAASALECLAGLTSSRLERTVVRTEELADHVSTGTMGLRDGTSMGYLVAQAADGVDLDRLESRLVEVVEDFAEAGPTPGDMEAVQAQAERSWLSELASIDRRADILAHTTCLFDEPQALNTYLDRLGAVSGDQVQQAARRWLRRDHCAVVTIASDAQGHPDPSYNSDIAPAGEVHA